MFAPSRPGREARLAETRDAFDSIAARYDDNNSLLQHMRRIMWGILEAELPQRGRLLDLGCGSGVDAVHMARRGHHVLAIDWSPEMVAQTEAEAARAGVAERVTSQVFGIHQLTELPVTPPFDGIYSDFGALNCVPDLEPVARACALRLREGGKLIVSVMGRTVPWEWLHYTLRGDRERAMVRARPGAVPVSLNGFTVWTRYYTPHELFQFFAPHFQLHRYRGLGLFLPPPYLVRGYERWPWLGALLGKMEDHLAGLPLLRDAGDHFVMTMIRRGGLERSDQPLSR
jgi:SAM-dependent methyltransferase